jgi:hypothetical protein
MSASDILGIMGPGLKSREPIEVASCSVIEVPTEALVLADTLGMVGIDNSVETLIERGGIVKDVTLVVTGCITWA